jgi:DNA-binding transcriptional LysR family regulator
MKVFSKVAELRSFAAAAEKMDLSPSMVSKHVMHLEKRLSTRLLNRTSRHVSLTEAGLLYFDQAQTMLEELENVEAAVSRTTATPHGIIKLSAPVWMANTPFVRLLVGYRERFPEVSFDVELSDRSVHLTKEGFDLALRVTHELDEGLVARKLAEITFHLVAAPTYLERKGRPASIAELSGHSILAYSMLPLDGNSPQGISMRGTYRVLCSGNETLLHLAALDGLGLTYMPRWLAEPHVAAGRLELVLPDEFSFQAPLFTVYPKRKYLSAKVRTFVDFLSEEHCFG